jgi:DEAD/DEAH box helicase domain-containing protein
MMLDPVGGFLRIRELFITYLETAFRIRDPGISAERRALLETKGALCTTPLLEPMPRYRTVDWRLRDLLTRNDQKFMSIDDASRQTFVRLISSGLFEGVDVRLYCHQAKMLERGTRAGAPGIVTSGTGSGKTESFLLPVLAQIVSEARSWARPERDYLQRRWWHDQSGKPYESFSAIPAVRRPLKKNPSADPFVPHRVGENRPAAMRCLILYPMNALVEDQLSRLRKALDSDKARQVSESELNGNRIFFGRYTSDTPVTGFDVHPRTRPIDDYKRRGQKLGELFKEMVQFERTQREVRKLCDSPNENFEDDDRYLFPSVDGAELLSRWDMQSHPPDILITNVSMLGAMLNREVDARLFEKTRQWLSEDENSYFYLILDELHLQRGAAGTEVSYLLRYLMHRLGLTDPKHRHKLRVLASSASLPTEGEPGLRSRSYLWDMFGSFGIDATAGRTGPDAWGDSIVPGEVEPEAPAQTSLLPTEAFIRFLRQHGGGKYEPSGSGFEKVPLFEESWRDVAVSLGVSSQAAISEVVRHSIEEAGHRVAAACWSESDERPRATELDVIARQIFVEDGNQEDALRGLLLIRGLGDTYPQWFELAASQKPLAAPAFRLHTFFRSIEGLYAPLDKGASCAPLYKNATRKIGQLSLERAATTGLAVDADTNDIPFRLLEVLYCECCGEIFVGGMRRHRGPNEYELLPTEADLDGLPDAAVSQRFEDLSFEQYALFWPTDKTSQPTVAIPGRGQSPEGWAPAHLDPTTSVVRVIGPSTKVPDTNARGWLFTRTARQDRHRRTNDVRGTNVPYECPACETDYSPRRLEGDTRLSPVRHFRTGFAKTTQLLASDLFHLLKLHTKEPKLVSFSDSRQDAAKAALDVESRHHEDVRRDVFVTALRRLQASSSTDSIDAELASLRQSRTEADARDDRNEDRRLSEEIDKLRQRRDSAREGTIRVADVLEDPTHPRYLGASKTRDELKPLIASFVTLGIHPVHPAGTKRFRAEVDGEARWFQWHELFQPKGTSFDWRDDARDQQWLNAARVLLVQEMQRLVTEIVFSRTYFSLEEAGLGYICGPRVGTAADNAGSMRMSAFLRVFGDAYRFLDSPYDTPPDPWTDENSISSGNKVMKFAAVLWQVGARRNLRDVLEYLRIAGHRDGLIATAALRVKLTSPEDPYWKCDKCTRVHLHRGADICTRCYTPLAVLPTGVVREIFAANFLSKRLSRVGSAAFRLHCEELTGQTDEGPDRQRKFRGILLPAFRPKLDADRKRILDENGDEVLVQVDPYFLREREEIDLLAVTTTMEVGIDIGPLQAILQANMPPQRFNYQQRVGRAGRRRQAYSFVLTVCRTKSHDLYYFREPRKITGDVPPPPFLTKGMPNIARRFIRKWWLNVAFADLRNAVVPWPADRMRPPDIHGEFVPTDQYFRDGWRGQLDGALRRTESSARDFAAMVCEASQLSPSEVWITSNDLLGEIDRLSMRLESVRPGLAHSLAEQGNLPMYGMPTRVRDLHTGWKDSGQPGQAEWSTIDRDLDLAVYEFAPGSVIVKDKHKHLCVGFTGPLGRFFFKQPPGVPFSPMSEPFGTPFWMLECVNCNSWFRYEAKPDDSIGECGSCGAQLDPIRSAECREPLGFRTNFHPSTDADSEGPSGRHRSIQSETGPMTFNSVMGSNLSVAPAPQIKTYRLNRGPMNPDLPGSTLGFSASSGRQRLTRGRRAEALLESQYISDDMVGDEEKEPRFFAPDAGANASNVSHVWLAAPKTTDAIYFSPTAIPPGLTLERVAGPRTLDGLAGPQVLNALLHTAVRAAALSAAFILTNRAALELDIDPEEFDVIEPRLLRPAGGFAVPVLQIADHLVNGAGFCDALGRVEPSKKTPLIASLLSSCLTEAQKYPLDEFLRGDHEQTCEQACYRCLLRYRNQPYHGLLDWRLGMTYLHALSDARYQCGLDGNFDSVALRSWGDMVAKDVKRVQRQFNRVASRKLGPTWAIKFDGASAWAVIGHPLWDSAAPTGILSQALGELGTNDFIVVDSFNLARRPITIRRAMLEGVGA